MISDFTLVHNLPFIKLSKALGEELKGLNVVKSVEESKLKPLDPNLRMFEAW